MLKQLIQLQIVKKRRNFKWKNLFLGAYFYVLIAILIVSSFAEMGGDMIKNALTNLNGNALSPQ